MVHLLAGRARPARRIAEKIVAKILAAREDQEHSAEALLQGCAMAHEIHKANLGPVDRKHGYPAHRAYIYAVGQANHLFEQLSDWKEMAPFCRILKEGQDRYMPGGPPMSPLTESYFTMWTLFDAQAGPFGETIGTTILEVGAAVGLDAGMLQLFRQMQDSRMGLYIFHGREGRRSILEDLGTGEVCRAIVPAGYRGDARLWYARVLPPPPGHGDTHVVMTTPYIVLHPEIREWRAYLERALPSNPVRADYENHMKYGPSRHYWNEYVLEGYVNCQFDAIFLTGLPDVPESLPHSQVSWEMGWKGPDFLRQE